jgi:hypothetical protein
MDARSCCTFGCATNCRHTHTHTQATII